MADKKSFTLIAQQLAARVEDAQRAGLQRHPPLVETVGEAPLVRVQGKKYINFISNDSLGQATCPKWRAIVAQCFAAYPASGTASRLAGGHCRLTAEAERAFAAYFGFAECLFLPSGYQANLACMTALLNAGQQVFTDRRIHASIARALPATRADIHTYAHGDYDHLERRLHTTPTCDIQPLVLTESLFSMDGTVLNVQRMAALRQKYGFFLFVDEAHAMGALGPGGRGMCATVPQSADVVLGTFGKALGLFGAFVLLPAGFTPFFEYLSSPIMHSTALPPAHAAASLRLLDILPHLDKQRERLQKNAQLFREALNEKGVSCHGTAHIIAVPTGDEARTARFGAQLQAKGILALAARYPTVPKGQGMLRFTVTALHSPAMLRHTARCVAEALHADGTQESLACPKH